MIAAVKAWHAVLTALLVWVPRAATAAEDLNGAARELAAKTALLAGAGTPVSVAYRNASSLGSAEFSQARTAFESFLRQAGGHTGEASGAIEIRLTVSENPSQYLLVEEARKGEERQVWISVWKRKAQALPATTGSSLEKKLVWEQDEAILDLAFPAGAMLLLAPSKVTWFARQNDHWEARQSVPLTLARPLPRDVRGHLHVNGTRFQAFLPGTTCSGGTDPALTVECHASDGPWILESGGRFLLLGNPAAGRDYFDGRVVTQTGAPKTVPPFFTAAVVEERGQPLWLLALVDGHTQILDANLNPLTGVPASLPVWGSDIAGVDARCGPATQVLATRAGENEADAIQSWSLVDRAATPVTAPVDFPGPVTALWTSGGTSAVAVSHDPATGKYAAYVLTVVCGS